MRMTLLTIVIASLALLMFSQAPAPTTKESHVPPLHNECLASPKYTSTGDGVGNVMIENICDKSVSARVCIKYSRKGWVCQLHAAVLPHANLKSEWSEQVTGTVNDVKTWATYYASGAHTNDYKNLPTVEEPNRPVYSR